MVYCKSKKKLFTILRITPEKRKIASYSSKSCRLKLSDFEIHNCEIRQTAECEIVLKQDLVFISFINIALLLNSPEVGSVGSFSSFTCFPSATRRACPSITQ